MNQPTEEILTLEKDTNDLELEIDEGGFLGITPRDRNKDLCSKAIKDHNGNFLSLKKILLAQHLCIPRALREKSISELAKELGETVGTLKKWGAADDVQHVMKKLRRLYFVDFVPDVVESLRARAMMGEVAAQRLFLEWAGEMEEVKEADVEGTGEKDNLSDAEVKERIKKYRLNHNLSLPSGSKK